MRHFYLSPHADDAALSCGAQIATLIGLGESVTILTLMAGDPSESYMNLPPAAYTEKLWTRWGLGRGSAATQARRAEDSAAAHALGASLHFGAFPDAIYRLADGRALYPDHAAIFGDLNPADPLLAAIDDESSNVMVQLNLNRSDILHIPLGVGHHVDHQWTRRLGQAVQMKAIGIDLRYYEEYPYSVRHADAVSDALQQAGIAAHAIPIVNPVSPEAIAVKIEAIGCYQSQISSLWPEGESIADSIRVYADHVGGEREWTMPALFR